jgi:phosphoribosylformimino-5-aminoimidazole carboxamide ribotide isomerase
MQLYPAIDIRQGRCVRLVKGRRDRETVYGDSPAEVALRWKSQGATYLHIVDLDGAFTGETGNRNSVVGILEQADLPVQLGGGIRTPETVEAWLTLGVRRVILGTAAVERPEMVGQAVDRWGPERIVVGIDAKAGRVAVNGWTSGTSCTALELAQAMKEAGVRRIIYTEIDRDGTMNGLDTGATARLARESGLRVIASGGVASLHDLEQASRSVEDGLEGVVLGKSLYEGTIDLSEAVRKYQPPHGD